MLTLGVWALAGAIVFLGIILAPWAVNQADKIKLDEDEEDES